MVGQNMFIVDQQSTNKPSQHQPPIVVTGGVDGHSTKRWTGGSTFSPSVAQGGNSHHHGHSSQTASIYGFVPFLYVYYVTLRQVKKKCLGHF